MLRVIILGSGASTPTPSRNQPCIIVNLKADMLMFDCGEGTQKQMMLARTGMGNLRAIFITHYHADHILGIPGVLQTLHMQGRTQKLVIYGPPGIHQHLDALTRVGYFRPGYQLELVELQPKDKIQFGDCKVRALETQHGVPSLGYVLEERPRPGKFDRDKAIQLGIKPGPLFKNLQSGLPVRIQGRLIIPEQILGPPRPGRKLVYTGDTRPCTEILENSRDADLLIHDGTFSHQYLKNAIEAGHSTLLEAAQIASKAGVRFLVTVHLSPRYEDPRMLISELRSQFPRSEIGRDFMCIDIPYPEKSAEIAISKIR